MSTSVILDSNEALKQLRVILEAMRGVADQYGEPEDRNEEDAEHMMSDQEMIDRIVEEAAEQGMDEENTERVFKIILTYCQKSAE